MRTAGHSLLRRLAHALVALVVLAALLTIAAGAYLLSLPSVTNAPVLVRRIDATHSAPTQPVPPPARLAAAVVATEDENFYSNVVIDVFDGAGRAALATIRSSGDPGGSTIIQQLAKLVYHPGHGVGGVLEEIGLGVKLALSFAKPHLLSMYLSAAYFGNGYWGDVAAAKGYFGLAPGQLDWSQAAMLAGLLQAPSAYDPVQHPRAAHARLSEVMDRLVDTRVLSKAQEKADLAAGLGLVN